MRNLILILLFFSLQLIAPVVCLSQNHKIDSLANKLTTAKEDTNKAKVLEGLQTCLFMNSPGKSFDYAKQELALSEKLNYKRGVITAYQNIAGYYYHMPDLDSALYYTNKAIPIIEQTNNKKFLAATYQHLATIAFDKTDYSSALDYSNKGLQVATQIKDSNLISKIMGVEGTVYTYLSNYPTALSYLLVAARISREINDKVSMATAYWYIGYVYELEHNNDKAVTYYTLALKNAREANDKYHTASSLAQLGEVCQLNKQLDKALDYFQQALSLYQELGSALNISSSTRSIAMIYNEYGNYDKAISLMNQSFKLSNKINSEYELCAGYGNMGEIYMKMKDYRTAISYLNKGLVLAKASKQKNNESCALDDLAKCYEALNNYSSAYFYSSRYSSVKDSMLNDETVKKTVEMEAIYNSEKNEKEIALLTKNEEIQKLEIKKQGLLQKSLIAGMALMVILFFFVYRSYHTRQLLKLQTLRNKIASDLHDDIGSTLSSISIFTLMAREGSKEVIPMLDQIGDYSRNMLESMADIVWTINPNNDNFEKIILRMRSFAFELLGAKNIDFEFNADESLSSLKLSMELRKNLYLIFKEATNNMVKYSHANSAIFSITRSKNILTLLIRDNGKGFDVERETQGNGLKNMRNRAIGMGAKFLIESGPGKGTTIQLLIKAA